MGELSVVLEPHGAQHFQLEHHAGQGHQHIAVVVGVGTGQTFAIQFIDQGVA
ncbi:hypothetical protein D3C71_1886260 [compost metagenome]